MKIDLRYRIPAGIAKFGVACLCLTLGLTASAPVSAQTKDDANAKSKDKTAEEKPTALTHPANPMIWDVDAMMEQAVQQISKRYKLNPQQENYTRLLLTRRVREFLDEHEGEVRELLQESMDMQRGKAPNDKVHLQMWAQRALPLYQEASQAIIDGNEEWADILNDDQKRIHDADMALMRSSFDGATNTLNLWSQGKGPAMPTLRTASNRTNSTSDGKPNTGESVVNNKPRPVRRQNIEDNWKSYVTLFVQAYDLDQAATNSAREKIYKEQYDKAQKYRESRAADFAKIEKRLEELGKTDFEKRRKLKDHQQDLERRIYDLFVEMDRRLQRLPTAAQSANVNAEKKKQLDRLYAALSGETARKARKARDTAKKKRSTTHRRTKPDADTAETTSQPQAPKPEAKPAEPSTSENGADAAKPKQAKPAEPSEEETKPAPKEEAPKPEKNQSDDEVSA